MKYEVSSFAETVIAVVTLTLFFAGFIGSISSLVLAMKNPILWLPIGTCLAWTGFAALISAKQIL
jgi:hypothetical protein